MSALWRVGRGGSPLHHQRTSKDCLMSCDQIFQQPAITEQEAIIIIINALYEQNYWMFLTQLWTMQDSSENRPDLEKTSTNMRCFYTQHTSHTQHTCETIELMSPVFSGRMRVLVVLASWEKAATYCSATASEAALSPFYKINK